MTRQEFTAEVEKMESAGLANVLIELELLDADARTPARKSLVKRIHAAFTDEQLAELEPGCLELGL